MVHSGWYAATYPDVAELGLPAAEHYLRYGAAMGRNPGKTFDTRFYLETYPDAAASGMNPLVHYVTIGRDKGYAAAPAKPPKVDFFEIRRLLLATGLEDRAISRLEDVFAGDYYPVVRARAGLELALWYFRFRTEEGYRTAVSYLEKSAESAAPLELRRRLLMLKLICLYHLGERKQGLALYEDMACRGLISADGMLAIANLQDSAERRVSYLNRALATSGISPVMLLPDEGQPLYDRLAPREVLPPVNDGPKVTVLLAAYEAGQMIGTALRSLQAQTWRNLEIIVIDDCSPTMETYEVASRFAAADPRIRVLRMERNGGAYIARNHGLDLATGDYVTLHDADDWSHPSKIETQVRYMEANPAVMGCTSEQVRCTEDLIIGKPRAGGLLVVFNTSSFLWRRAPVREALGYWDTVRFSADSEFMRRMQAVFGQDCIVKLPTGILSFQREAESSVTTDPVKGLDGSGVFYGVRKEYKAAQDHHHATAASLRYTNDVNSRPFPVPPMMNLTGEDGYDRYFDALFCADFRDSNPLIEEIAAKIDSLRTEGRSVGLVEYSDGDGGTETIGSLIRAKIARGDAEVAVYGERVSCDRLFDYSSQAQPLRYSPTILTRTAGAE